MKKRLKQKEKKERKRAFDTHIRIRKSQLEYLNATRRWYSASGYLDMIINFWKDYEGLGFIDTKKEAILIYKDKKKYLVSGVRKGND